MKINQKISKNLCKGKVTKRFYWYIELSDYEIQELVIILNDLGLKTNAIHSEGKIIIEPKMSFKIVVDINQYIILRTTYGVFLLIDHDEFQKDYIKIK